MTTPTPEQFFLDNGGRSLLAAYGIVENPSFESFFSRRFQLIAKPGEELTDQTSAPASLNGPATVLAWNGGLHVYCMTTPGVEVPGVVQAKTRNGFNYDELLAFALNLPRPLLFLNVGQSYRPTLAKAAVTVDPDLVLVTGADEIVLERSRVDNILKLSKRYGCESKPLLDLVSIYESALVQDDRILSLPKNLKLASKFLTTAGLEADDVNLRNLWKNLDQMPVASDPAWRVIRHLQPAAPAA